MRIAIVSRIYLPEPAAAAFALGALAEILRRRGHEVTVVTSRPPRGMPTADRPGIRVHRAPVLRDRQGFVRGYLPYLSFDVPLVVRLLLGQSADVYVVEPPPTTGAVVRIVAAVRRRPYVYDAADIWSDAARLETGSRLIPRLLLAVERFALRGAAALTTISTGVVRRLGELGVATPANISGFGADAATFGYDPQGPVGSPYFLYAGTYSHVHGAGIFVDAFLDFRRTHPRHRLIFVGSGTDRPVLEARCRAEGIDGVEFRDPVEPSALRPLFAGAIAALASNSPGTGYEFAFATKIYSALASGTPVLFTGVGPTAGFVHDAVADGVAAGVVADFDPSAVAEAMRTLADAPSDPDARRRLAGWTAEHHSLDAVAQRMADTVEGVRRR